MTAARIERDRAIAARVRRADGNAHRLLLCQILRDRGDQQVLFDKAVSPVRPGCKDFLHLHLFHGLANAAMAGTNVGTGPSTHRELATRTNLKSTAKHPLVISLLCMLMKKQPDGSGETVGPSGREVDRARREPDTRFVCQERSGI